ncbi:phosphatase PAP2 family protein [Nakamurella flavida]|uniref:Phosphatase PAP2 family protein n=1 Tax=Nakamurella flavida TaxID=363630 RepID=A0A939BZ33_9ACTN|nr:phosphatase PAP2 family protein [Nakamurella flavida]MBM9475303.1 phosphatase PAP2 family protein [Nakamurella flavida]MDP9776877.1 hypothetical protein [Nakamurella flavida]
MTLLDGFAALWTSDGTNDLHGTVLDAATLARNDQVVTWVNGNATAAQQFSALQTSAYENKKDDTYDESITVAPGLGSVLAPIYVQGRQTDALPLTDALLASTGGSSGDFLTGIGAAKDAYSYPRPFLASDTAAPPAGEPCSESDNGESLQANRVGKPYADATGNLLVTRVGTAVDTTHTYADHDVVLDPGYAGLCTAGSFPSGHTATAYQSGITLATLLPELAPEILSRASEQANNRLVLGVHYPLDLMGGRISGEAGIAAQWSDAQYVSSVLLPARAELVAYLQAQCGDVLTACIARSTPYQADPYGGSAMPGGTAQIVTDRASAVAAYTERLTYGFPSVTASGAAPAVPAGAENLLLTTFPTLTDAQRDAVLAQTQIPAGYALDRTMTGEGSWQRLDLAAAMSATVQLDADGSVTVTGTGGTAQVLPAPTPTTPPVPTTQTDTTTTPASTDTTTPTSTDTPGTSETTTTPTPTPTPKTETETETESVVTVSVVTIWTSRGPVGYGSNGFGHAEDHGDPVTGQLAATGVPAARTTWLGFGVLIGGAGLVLLGRTRRRSRLH